MVKLPVSDIVTLWDANTPLLNVAVVPLPADSVPVEVISTVFPAPVKAVTVLLLESLAVTWILNGEPAVCVPMAPPPCASTRKLLSDPGSTVNEFDVPVSLPVPNPPALSVAVISKLPVLEMVTLWDASTPLVKFAVAPLPAERVPVELISTVFPAPVKAVTVLLTESSAVIWILKDVPAVWVAIFPPPWASTTK